MSSQVSIWASRAQGNLQSTFSKLSVYDYIRLVIIVGAYCLLRPYLMKLGGKLQAKQHEAEIDTGLDDANRAAANSIRGEKVSEVPDDTDDEDEEETAAASASQANWGRSARRKQRTFVKQVLKVEEDKEKARRAMQTVEVEEGGFDPVHDKDIEEFLEE